jgi:hypothetical protein
VDVYTYEFWATDIGFGTDVAVKQNFVRFKTVYLSHRPYGPKATAQICLSRRSHGRYGYGHEGADAATVHSLSIVTGLSPTS